MGAGCGVRSVEIAARRDPGAESPLQLKVGFCAPWLTKRRRSHDKQWPEGRQRVQILLRLNRLLRKFCAIPYAFPLFSLE